MEGLVDGWTRDREGSRQAHLLQDGSPKTVPKHFGSRLLQIRGAAGPALVRAREATPLESHEPRSSSTGGVRPFAPLRPPRTPLTVDRMRGGVFATGG